MGMFAFLSTQTLIIVLVVALIVFGPQKLPDIGRQLGSAMRELRKMSGDMQRALDIDSHTSSYDYYNSSRYDSASSYSYTPSSDTPLDQYGLDHHAPMALEGGTADDAVAAEVAGSSDADASAVEKPKRKRTRKVDTADAGDEVGAIGPESADTVSSAEPKPRRPRRKATEIVTESGEASGDSVVEPKSPRNRKRTGVETPASDIVESTAMVADAPEAETVSTPAA